MNIEKIEHLSVDGRKVIRIVWRHPLSAMAACLKGPHQAMWAQLITDWMPADVAKELVDGIQKALRQKPKKVPMPKKAN